MKQYGIYWIANINKVQISTIGKDAARGLILLTLAFVQPVYSLLEENAEFFTAHNVGLSHLFVLILSISVLIPLSIITTLTTLRLFGRKIYQVFQCLFIFCVTFLIVLPLIEKSGIPMLALKFGLAFFLSSVFLYVYLINENLRSPLLFLAPVLVVIPLLFFMGLNSAYLSKGVMPVVEKTSKLNDAPPIFLLIFDEFSLNAVMNDKHKIDAKNYPNLAWLADRSTWFRNATTVADGTTHAVPSILTGLYGKDNLPIYQDHPESIFTILKNTHRFNVHESSTSLCPKELCESILQDRHFENEMALLLTDTMVLYLHLVFPEEYSHLLPDISQAWSNFLFTDADKFRREYPILAREWLVDLLDDKASIDRVGLWHRFLGGIKKTAEPSLNLLHILLPHTPFQYLPSGQNYRPQAIRGLEGERWVDNEWLVNQAWQRHLLQLSYVDKLLGELINKMKDEGLFESALLVLVADHGVSFKAGELRRPLSENNYMDILPIPLFIKTPYQEVGIISDENVESIDILPSILDVLGENLDLEFDGVSALNSSSAKLRKTKSVLSFHKGEKLKTFPAQIPEKYETVKKRIELFSDIDGIENLFKLGKHGFMLDSLVEAYPSKTKQENILETELDVRLHQYEKNAGPNFIKGQIFANKSPLSLALAVNGIIRSVSNSVMIRSRNEFLFLVPETAYTSSENQIEIYQIEGETNPSLSLIDKPALKKYSFSRLNDKLNLKENGSSLIYVYKEDYMVGFLDDIEASGEKVLLRGWAISPQANTLADQIVIFNVEEFLASADTKIRRPDISKAYKDERFLYSGFNIVLDKNVMSEICRSDFQIFALSSKGKLSSLVISEAAMRKIKDC